MAATDFTPIQLFRSVNTGVGPAKILDVPLNVTVLANTNQLIFSRPPEGDPLANLQIGWSVFQNDTVPDAVGAVINFDTNVISIDRTTVAAQTTVTLNKNVQLAGTAGTLISFQQLQEGELFVNIADKRLAVGAYGLSQASLARTPLGIVDLIPSTRGNAGLVLRVDDTGTFITWGNQAANVAGVSNVWAGQITDPYDMTPNVSGGILTTPTTTYVNVQQAGVTITAMTMVSPGMFDLTYTGTLTIISSGDTIGSSDASIKAGNLARITLINPASQTITIVIVAGDPFPSVPSNLFRAGLSSSGITAKGFVNTDPAVVPYMAPRNRATTPFTTATMYSIQSGHDTNIPGKVGIGRVVDPTQGGFGASISSRQELNNAAAPTNIQDSNLSLQAVTTPFWQKDPAGHGAYYGYSGTNRLILTNNGVDVSWQRYEQPLDNLLIATASAPTGTNGSLSYGLGNWLKISQNNTAAINNYTVTPANQDYQYSLVQTAAVPVRSGGTGLDATIAGQFHSYGLPYFDSVNTAPMKIVPTPVGATATSSLILKTENNQDIVWSNNLNGFTFDGTMAAPTEFQGYTMVGTETGSMTVIGNLANSTNMIRGTNDISGTTTINTTDSGGTTTIGRTTSGLTTINGDVVISTGASNSLTVTGEVDINRTGNAITTIGFAGATNIGIGAGATNIGTGTGNTTIGNSTGNVAINAENLAITVDGNTTENYVGLSAVNHTADATITAANDWTLRAADAHINIAGTGNTNIGTGTNTGVTTIGNAAGGSTALHGTVNINTAATDVDEITTIGFANGSATLDGKTFFVRPSIIQGGLWTSNDKNLIIRGTNGKTMDTGLQASLDGVTTSGQGLYSIRITSANNVGSSIDQIAEDYASGGMGNALSFDATQSTVQIGTGTLTFTGSAGPPDTRVTTLSITHTGSSISSFCGSGKGISGVTYFGTTQASGGTVVVNFSGFGAMKIFYPLAGVTAAGQVVAVSWWTTGSIGYATVSVG